jgi:cell division protein FtsA
MLDVNPVASAEEGVETVRVTRAQLIAVIRQRLELLMGEIAHALKGISGFSGPFGRRVWCSQAGAIGAEGRWRHYAQAVLAAPCGVRPATGSPLLAEAHSGPRPLRRWPALPSSPRPWTRPAPARRGCANRCRNRRPAAW